MRHLEYFNDLDNLEKEDNPNFGLFRSNYEKMFNGTKSFDGFENSFKIESSKYNAVKPN